jgi:hypothetical protein
MRPYLFLVLLFLLWPLCPAPAAADAGLAGHWEGEATDEEGRRDDIEIAIARDGRASFEYAASDADRACVGSLTLLGRENESFVYRELVIRGPADCKSHGRVTLKPRSGGVLLGFHRTGGGGAMSAELHGFRLTVSPETCAECDEAEGQDEIGCRYLAEKEQRNDAANEACLKSAAAFAATCRAALRCPAPAP